MLKAKENYNKMNLSEQSRNKARIRETGLSLHTKTDRRGVTSLVSLDLTGCDFHGRIPSFRNLTSLELLHVGVNDFMNSSSIFQELSSSNLISLDIGGCGISSSVLDSLQNLTNLISLNLSGNQLTKRIPKSFRFF
ncbi:putative non-specific serine/threonine protein kinase [Helianthus annuus]|nr:putative non-specific serine/threonine protein kinase [Helianthus annuus]KAJ0756889.1 putative non-specific serine/threonine protein kinase [Helianthus annuus]